MIKVGIIGAGRIGHVHGESISKFVKHAEVKTVADPFMNEKTEAWAKSLGIRTPPRTIMKSSTIQKSMLS